ncbi:MAG: lipid A biosynthesis acyltransferase [Sulfuricella sp.]|nr:lipid A biosynthesis acyltransferase [Sulfuricella sp.]
MARLGITLIWLLHFLPLGLLARLGEGFGLLLYLLGRERRRVARINLRLCFPELQDEEREKLVRRHFRAFGRSVLERGILWWSPKSRVQRLVHIEGLEHWQAVAGKPAIWLAPHFVGLDMGGVRLTTDYPLVSMYSKQKNPLFDALLLHSRTRFGNSPMASRQDGLKPVVRAMRNGLPFYYLPDMDFGARDAVFVPFFGVPAATITGLSRLAKITGAAVVPCVTRQLAGGAGYVLKFYPAWSDFPGADVEADARRMNAFIEERVREMPEQYFWLHKRFKTRPPGEQRFYG